MSQRGVNAVRSRRAARSRGKSGALINRGYRSDPPGIKQESGLSSPAMPFISGKQAFLQILKQEGVSVMFGNPGTTELPLMDGLAREPGIHYVLALQEAAAIAMTDGYAQASGGLGAVNVHVSPGLGNAMGMLYDAYTRVAPRIVGDRKAIDEAAKKLARAERPLLVAGDAVAHSNALAELVELAELLGAPVVTEGVASTCSFPFSHPLYIGSFPRLAPPIRAFLMRYDLMCSIGGDLFTLSLPSDVEPMPDGLDVIHIDVDPWEIGKNYAASIGIQGDPKATLPELSEAVRRHTSKTGHPQAARRREAVAAAFAEERAEMEKKAHEAAAQSPMGPLALVHAVARATPAGATIVEETISSAAGVRHFFRCEDSKSFFGLRGGGIGWGLPAAIGVKLALPDRPVIAMIGDGSAMYTCQGLWTAARESLAIVYVIFNNSSYRILKQRTLALKGFSAEDDFYVGMDLDKPFVDYVGLSRSLGVPGERVEKAAEVGPAIGRGLASGGPYLIDVRIDPAFKSPLISRRAHPKEGI